MIKVLLGDGSVHDVDSQKLMESSDELHTLLSSNHGDLSMKEIPSIERLNIVLNDEDVNVADDNDNDTLDRLINKANDAHYLGFHHVLHKCTRQLTVLLDSGVKETIKHIVKHLNHDIFELLDIDSNFFVDRCMRLWIKYPMPAYVKHIIASSTGSGMYKMFAVHAWNAECKKRGLITQ